MPCRQVFHNLLHVAQLLIFLFQGLLHPLFELCSFEFFQQKTVVIVLFIRISLKFLQFLKFLGFISQFLKLLCVSGKIFGVLRQSIQYLHLEIIVGQLHRLMLGVHIYQLIAQGAHHIQGHRGIVHKCPRFTTGQNLSSENGEVLIIQIVLLKKGLELVIGHLELCLYNTFLLRIF